MWYYSQHKMSQGFMMLFHIKHCHIGSYTKSPSIMLCHIEPYSVKIYQKKTNRTKYPLVTENTIKYQTLVNSETHCRNMLKRITNCEEIVYILFMVLKSIFITIHKQKASQSAKFFSIMSHNTKKY